MPQGDSSIPEDVFKASFHHLANINCDTELHNCVHACILCTGVLIDSRNPDDVDTQPYFESLDGSLMLLTCISYLTSRTFKMTL